MRTNNLHPALKVDDGRLWMVYVSFKGNDIPCENYIVNANSMPSAMTIVLDNFFAISGLCENISEICVSPWTPPDYGYCVTF